MTENIKSMENVQKFTFIELRITQAALTLLSSFFRCELACFDQVGRTGSKPNSDFRWLGKSEGCAIAN